VFVHNEDNGVCSRGVMVFVNNEEKWCLSIMRTTVYVHSKEERCSYTRSSTARTYRAALFVHIEEQLYSYIMPSNGACY